MRRATSKAAIDDIIVRHLPEGVKVHWRTDGKWKPAHTNQTAEHGKEMLSPYPDTPFKALVFLHECAHFANGDFRVDTPMHVEEYRAEALAMAWWRMLGYKVPAPYLAAARKYVRDCIRCDRKRRIAIKPHIARWAKQ